MIGPARFLDDSKERLVRLDDGTEMRVPTSALEPQPDGSFYLKPRTGSPALQNMPTSAPAMQSEVQADPRVEAGSREVQPPRSDTVESQLFRHGYTVRKVAVDRVLDEPALPRQEGDTMIYPVMEEVLVVQKRLILKEEIHITPERSAIEPRRVELEANGTPLYGR